MKQTLEGVTIGFEEEVAVPWTHDRNSVNFLPKWDGVPWNFHYDGSIHVRRYGWTTAEYVSPIINGSNEAIFEFLVEAVTALKERGARVNNTCGGHIHVGTVWDDKQTVIDRTWEFLSTNGKLLFDLPGARNRQYNNYCRIPHDKHWFLRDRFYAINVTALNRHQTLEFRLWAGTLNAPKVAANALTSAAIFKHIVHEASTPRFESAGELLEYLGIPEAISTRRMARFCANKPAYFNGALVRSR